MAFGTAKGPTRLGPLVRVVSAASTMVRVEGPPEPMMMPVISWEISLAVRPASRIACSTATWFQAAPPPRNRMARRSTTLSASRLGAPCTWQRKPSSAYLSARTIPDLASRRLARTSWVLLPIDETMPMPVTTTRLMQAPSAPLERNRCDGSAIYPSHLSIAGSMPKAGRSSGSCRGEFEKPPAPVTHRSAAFHPGETGRP